MSASYRYGEYRDLTAAQLFFVLATEEAGKRLDSADLTALAHILAGRSAPTAPIAARDAARRNALSAIVARARLGHVLKQRIFPTLRQGDVKQLRASMQRRLGNRGARGLTPGGEALTGNAPLAIGQAAAQRYNRLVSAEDRIA